MNDSSLSSKDKANGFSVLTWRASEQIVCRLRIELADRFADLEQGADTVGSFSRLVSMVASHIATRSARRQNISRFRPSAPTVSMTDTVAQGVLSRR